jgi:hypothetical protein
MFDGTGAGLANLMSYPVLIGAILFFMVSLVVLITKKAAIRKGIKSLLTIVAVLSGVVVIFLIITMFAFGRGNHEIAEPVSAQTMRNSTTLPTGTICDLSNNGKIIVSAQEASNHRLNTNSEKISVSIDGDNVSDNAQISLYNADGMNEIQVMQIRPDKKAGTFTNLTSANEYYIVATGLDGCEITVSE